MNKILNGTRMMKLLVLLFMFNFYLYFFLFSYFFFNMHLFPFAPLFLWDFKLRFQSILVKQITYPNCFWYKIFFFFWICPLLLLFQNVQPLLPKGQYLSRQWHREQWYDAFCCTKMSKAPTPPHHDVISFTFFFILFMPKQWDRTPSLVSL